MEFELRPWQQTDAQDIAVYADNKMVAQNLRDVFPHPYTLEDARQYVDLCIAAGDSRQLCYAVCIDGRASGSIGVFLKDDVYCKSAELGYWLGEPFWGQGIMRRAIMQVCAEAFERYDIVRIFAEPYADNQGSRKALEYAGFVLEGIMRDSVWKNGSLHDSCMYALLKSKV